MIGRSAPLQPVGEGEEASHPVAGQLCSPLLVMEETEATATGRLPIPR
jgi:hypothetical protein